MKPHLLHKHVCMHRSLSFLNNIGRMLLQRIWQPRIIESALKEGSLYTSIPLCTYVAVSVHEKGNQNRAR
jgi:hypothetical protein